MVKLAGFIGLVAIGELLFGSFWAGVALVAGMASTFVAVALVSAEFSRQRMPRATLPAPTAQAGQKARELAVAKAA